MAGHSRTDIPVEGPRGRVEFARTKAGKYEAREWYSELSVTEKAQFGVLFEVLVNRGTIHNTKQFRHLGDEVYEFKRGIHRLLCYHVGRRWLLTHRVKKCNKKEFQKEIVKADRIGREHLDWEMKQRKNGNGG